MTVHRFMRYAEDTDTRFRRTSPYRPEQIHEDNDRDDFKVALRATITEYVSTLSDSALAIIRNRGGMKCVLSGRAFWRKAYLPRLHIHRRPARLRYLG